MQKSYIPRWHKRSYDHFLNERLPQLLAHRLPLMGYQVESTDAYQCRVSVILASSGGQTSREYLLPYPDETGLFRLEGQDHPRVVLPWASSAALETAEVSCVGEQLHTHIQERLGEAPGDLPWDERLMGVWLPLDDWVKEFFVASPFSQPLESLNWLSRVEHTRRIRLLEPDLHFNPEQFGRVCPIQMPEGPNICYIRHIAVGADIRDERVVIVDEASEHAMGVATAMIPFFENGDRNRRLMGANMMRQWHIPQDPEPALVQTGNEPDEPDFWGGRNLLTAFIAWDSGVHEDGIVLSVAGAKRLGYPRPVEIGDKLSNRHGIKGVVSRILPDEEMPKLADGTPVELICSPMGTLSRMAMGQLREGVMSRIARAEGAPAIVPPLHAPTEEEIRERLRQNGLPEDGMETLTVAGKPLDRPSTVGWVYWGRTTHLAGDKIRVVSQTGPDQGEDKVRFPRHYPRTKPDSASRFLGQRRGEMEFWVTRDLGAYKNAFEAYNTLDQLSEYLFFDPEDAGPSRRTLVEQLMEGPVEQAGVPSPKFVDLQRRLALAGIHVAIEEETVTFRFGPPEGDRLTLARSVPHPWLRERELKEVGLSDKVSASRKLRDTHAKLAQMLSGKLPDSLVYQAEAQLREVVETYFDELLTGIGQRIMILSNRMHFSGRGVIVPGADLHHDQIGIADETAWVLFGPLVARETGDQDAVAARTEQAAQALDEIMARSWVIVNRAPTIEPTNLCACHPVRVPGFTIQIHPFLCPFMNADFDGDQMAVFLPITEATQQEAGERLSVAAHVKRDPALIHTLAPTHDAMFGLAALSLTKKGRQEIGKLAGIQVEAPDGYITRTTLGNAMARVVERDGVETALDTLERLIRRGYQIARSSGASISPFMGSSLNREARPADDDPKAWERYAEELIEQVAARTDFDSPDLGVPLLMTKSGARGQMTHIRWWVGATGNFMDESGLPTPVRHSLGEGLSVQEMRCEAIGSHRALVKLNDDMLALGREFRQKRWSKSFTPLARAMRMRGGHAGIVFARAAAINERDPLTDPDSRIFVGLPVKG